MGRVVTMRLTNCNQCGAPLHKWKHKQFCSKECSNAHQRTATHSQETRDAILELSVDGWSAQAVAIELGLGKGQVEGIRKRSGMRFPRQQKLERFLGECVTCKTKLVGKQKRFCSVNCANENYKLRVHAPERREAVAEMSAEGITTYEMARRLGVTVNVIVGLRRRMNLPHRPSPLHQPKERSERYKFGPEPLPPMHPIAWKAIYLETQAPL